MKLTISSAITVDIYASKKWNNTSVEVVAGEIYDFTAEGTWTDLGIHHTADGGTNSYMNLFNNKKRSKENLWFALMGNIDKSPSYFLIGSSLKQFPIPSSGTLYCFANDANRFYWNNCGKLNLTIKRIK